MDWFKLFYTVLGGLGVFFFGMKLLSEGLQATSGPLIRKIINSLTTNRFIAVGVGLLVTTIVQSSSVTTVMIVGFVNAGLMSLSQALGVILGSNIGTTITGWIIAIKIGKYSLLLIGLGFIPLLYGRDTALGSWGRTLFALGLVFLGLSTMSGAFKPLRYNEDFLAIMTYFTADSFPSLVATILVGCVLTFIVQSSSAMLGITIALASTGAISFQTALALVMGENIGTTVTALLASIPANSMAKRAAIGHATFNVLGVIILTSIFWTYLEFVEWVIDGKADLINSEGEKPNIAAHIAAGHTIFNVVNTIVFLPLLPYLTKFVSLLIPIHEKSKKRLTRLGTADALSPGMAIVQTRMEINRMAILVKEAIAATNDYLNDPGTNRDRRKKVQKYESITDSMHQEVMEFAGDVMQTSLTSEETQKINSLLQISDELESLADYCLKIVKQLRRLEDENTAFDDETTVQLNEMMALVSEAFDHVLDDVANDQNLSYEKVLRVRDLFNEKADYARKSFLNKVRTKNHKPLYALTIVDIISSLGRTLSHTRKLAEAQTGKSVNFVE